MPQQKWGVLHVIRAVVMGQWGKEGKVFLHCAIPRMRTVLNMLLALLGKREKDLY